MGGKTKKIVKNCEKKWAENQRKQQKTVRKMGGKTKKIAKNYQKKWAKNKENSKKL